MLKTTSKWVAIGCFAAMLGACAPTQSTRSTGEYADDTAITARARVALINAPELKSNSIQVETFRGVVQLSGFAESAESARLAMDAVRNLEGVREVRNDIRIRPRQ